MSSFATRQPSRLTLERDRLTLERDRLTLERDRLTLEQDRLTLERDRLTLERDRLTLEPSRLTECQRPFHSPQVIHRCSEHPEAFQLVRLLDSLGDEAIAGLRGSGFTIGHHHEYDRLIGR